MSTISITIPNVLDDFLNHLSQKEHIDKSQLIKRAIIGMMEDYEDLKLIEESIKESEGKPNISIVELKKMLDEKK